MALRFWRRKRLFPGLRVNLEQERRERVDQAPRRLVHHRPAKPARKRRRSGNRPILGRRRNRAEGRGHVVLHTTKQETWYIINCGKRLMSTCVSAMMTR
jgi:hypothetical protein